VYKLNKKVLIYASTIIVVAVVVYWFSFYQMLKSETYFFFWRTQVIDNIQWYQFLLSPSGYSSGDTWLFRPLTYLLDSLRHLWFGTNYTLWHILSVTGHILAGLALFRLLWKIKPSVLALVASLLFITTPVLAGAVLYEDINGYQLFVALMLSGIYYGLKLKRTIYYWISLFGLVLYTSKWGIG